MDKRRSRRLSLAVSTVYTLVLWNIAVVVIWSDSHTIANANMAFLMLLGALGGLLIYYFLRRYVFSVTASDNNHISQPANEGVAHTDEFPRGAGIVIAAIGSAFAWAGFLWLAADAMSHP